MQRSEHPSGLFAGLAEIDPLFVWQGDCVGIVLTVVAASFSPVIRSRLSRWSAGVTFRESHALGKRMAGSCQRRFPVVPRYRQRPLWRTPVKPVLVVCAVRVIGAGDDAERKRRTWITLGTGGLAEPGGPAGGLTLQPRPEWDTPLDGALRARCLNGRICPQSPP